MASKVNKKFVVGLTLGVVLVCGGVVGVAAWLLNNTAADNVRAGDAMAASGDHTLAAEQYGKAVNKEKTNTAYLTKWVEALAKCNADTQVKYEKLYQDWAAALRQLAVVDSGNVAAQKQYLELQRRLVDSGPFSEDGYSFLAGEADTMVRLHQGPNATPGDTLMRYRGIANLALYFNSPTPKEEQLTGAVADLKAALQADPTDSECAVGLADISLRKSAQAYQELRKDEATALEKESDDTLSAFLQKNPDHPDVLLSLIQRDVVRVQRKLMEAGTAGDPEKESQDFAKRATPILDTAVASAKKMPAPLNEHLLRKFRTVESLVAGNALPRTEELTRESLRAAPSSPTLLAFLADVLTARNDTAGAIEQFDKISNLPTPPISLDGRMLFELRKAALSQQAYLAARSALGKESGADRESLIAKAKALRTKVAEQEAADSTRLTLVDATLAILENTNDGYTRAGQLLDQYNRKTDKGNPEAVQLAAMVAVKQNQFGAARDLYGQVIRLQPTNIGAMLALAEIHANLQEYTPALNYYRQVLRLDPGNDLAQRGQDLMAAFTGQATSKDPVVQVLLDAERVRREGITTENIQRILKILGDGYAKHKDPRLAQAYANSLAGDNQRDKALQVLDEAIKANPDDAMLKQRREVLNAGNAEEGLKKIINESNAPEVDKRLQTFSLYVSQGKEREALAELDAAAKAGPDDPRVMELQFLRAVEAGKMDEAKALADKSAKINADSQQGDTYRARLLEAQGEVKQAVTVLQACVQRGGAQPEVHRLLGRMLMRDGRAGDAANAFRESLRLRPTDVPTTVDLLQTLIATGNTAEALSVAREFQRYGEGDVRFLPVWLDIEAAAGDRDMAVTRREQLMRNRPDDRANLMSLANLYIQTNKHDKARPLIDKVRASQDGLDAVGLDALWNWNQRKQDEARKVYSDYIAKQDAAQTVGATGSYAAFLLDRGDVAGGLALLEGIRAKQDPARMEVDRALSDLYTRLGRPAEALEAARRVTDAKADTPDRLYQKRAVELLTGTGKLDEAQSALDKLTSGTDPDAITLLLAAQLADAQKKPSAQMDALNRAVAKFPTNPSVFLRRAEAFMRDAGTFRDAEADLSKAIELAPQDSLLRQRRAQLRMQAQNESAAIQDMRDAVRLAPRDNDLLFGTLTQLFQLGKEQEMSDLASEAARQRSRDPALQLAMGQFYQKLPVKQGDTSTITRNVGFMRQYFDAAYKLDDSEYNALTYVAALLANPGADPAAAEKVITDAGDRAKKSPGYQMTLARIRMMQGRKPDALRIAQEALRLADPTRPTHMNAWISDLARMLPDIKERVAYLENTGRAGLAPEWMKYYRSADMINDAATRTEGLAGMKEIAAGAKLDALREAAAFETGRAHLVLGNYEEAVRVWKEGLASFPNNAEMNNNTAYVLAENLNRAEEALPLAEQAARLSPASPDVQDTLGTVLLKLGKAGEAAPHFERALQRSTDPRSALTIAMHLVEAFLQSGNPEGAKRAMQMVTTMQERSPGLFTEGVTKQVQELRTRVGGR